MIWWSSDKSLEKAAASAREAGKRYDATVAKGLLRLIKLIESADCIQDLLDGPGRWEGLNGNRRGQHSARVSANDRLIVIFSADEEYAELIEICDYHKR